MFECATVVVALLGSTAVSSSPWLVEVTWFAILKGPIRAFGSARLGAVARLRARAGLGTGAAAAAAAVTSWAAFLLFRAFVGIVPFLLALVASDV